MEVNQYFKKKTQRFLVVDLGQLLTTILHLEAQPNGFRLISYDGKRILPTEEKKEEVITAFIDAFLKTNNILDKDIILNISEVDSVIVKYLALPVMPEQEIPQAAKWQLREEVSFDLESALIDWQLVKDYTDEEGIKRNGIIFIAAKREAIDTYLSYVYKCNLEPLAVTSGPFNYANLIKYLPENLDFVAVLDIDYLDSTLSIYAENKLNFSRKLPFSGDKFLQSLTGVLASDKGKVELSLAQAEEVIDTFGIPQDNRELIKGNIQAGYIISLMRPLLETLVREIKLSFNYFASNFAMQQPLAIYLTGAGANLKNLDKYLNKELKINVTHLPIPLNLDIQLLDKEKLEKDKNKIMNALGAAYGGTQKINLLPLEIKTKKFEFVQRLTLRIVTIVVGTIFLFFLLIARFQIWDLQKRLKNAQLHLQAIESIKTLNQKIVLRQNLINRMQKDKVPGVGLLKVIGVLVPQNIILDELILDQTSHTLNLKGSILASEDMTNVILTNFMQQLERSLFITEVGLVSSTKVGMISRFEIKCDLAHPG